MVVICEDTVSGVVGRIYESVERPELWPETIGAIGSLVGGRRDLWGLIPGTEDTNAYILGTGCHPTVFLSRNDMATLDQYAQEFGDLIAHFLKVVFLSILHPAGDASVREGIGLRMVRRFPQAFEDSQDSLVSSAQTAAWRELLVSLWQDGRAFTRDDVHCMRLIVPHLDRAWRLQMRLSAADLRADMVTGAFDCLNVGTAFVDRSGRFQWLNRRAREILSSSAELRLTRSDQLLGRGPSNTQALRELIAGALSAGKQRFVAVNRDNNVRPLLLVALPLRPSGHLDPSFQLVWGVVFIIDPDRTDNPTVDSLRHAFHLTYREAHVAIAVAQGHGLQAAAAAMGVALTTARSQLQQVFAKTGTGQQAELAALVNRALTVVRHE
jgi:DNA-binding CsgD family transcriptional regulator